MHYASSSKFTWGKFGTTQKGTTDHHFCSYGYYTGHFLLMVYVLGPFPPNFGSLVCVNFALDWEGHKSLQNFKLCNHIFRGLMSAVDVLESTCFSHLIRIFNGLLQFFTFWNPGVIWLLFTVSKPFNVC